MARRKRSSGRPVDYSRYTMLIVGIVLIVVAAFVLVDATKKESRCESLGGKIVQIFDAETESECGTIWIFKLLSYIGIALGVALAIIGFLRLN